MFTSLGLVRDRIAHRLGRWPRRLLALGCLAVAALDALHAGARPAPPATARVVVAARDLPVGHVLTPRDLHTRVLPRRYRPVGAQPSGRALLGERLATPVVAGAAVLVADLVGRTLTSGLDPGLVASSVELPGDVRALVRRGERIDLLALAAADDPGGPRARAPAAVSAARAALVLAVLPGSGAAGTGPDTDVMIATSRADAIRIAELRTSYLFAAVSASP